MKLNYKRTICVGFAFFLICAFWQAYDNTVPLILTNKFGMSQAWSGVIMALDNILALFLLPLFGALSDRTSTKIGRRMPFILLGTACAALLMNLLPLPALDGGHVLFLLVNGIAVALFKKEIPSKYLNVINGIGFALLMALMLFVTFHDIVKLL